jgi:hypothetical protein
LIRKEASSYISIFTVTGKEEFNYKNKIGNLSGILVSFNLLIQLTSARFCNKYIYSEDKAVQTS